LRALKGRRRSSAWQHVLAFLRGLELLADLLQSGLETAAGPLSTFFRLASPSRSSDSALAALPASISSIASAFTRLVASSSCST
jgi:hypothetical protein